MKQVFFLLIMILLVTCNVRANEAVQQQDNCVGQLYGIADMWEQNYGITSNQHKSFEHDDAFEGIVWLMRKVNDVDFDECSEKIKGDIQTFKATYQTMISASNAAEEMDQLVEQKRDTGELTEDIMAKWSATHGFSTTSNLRCPRRSTKHDWFCNYLNGTEYIANSSLFFGAKTMSKMQYPNLIFVLLMSFATTVIVQAKPGSSCTEQLYSLANTWDENHGISKVRHDSYEESEAFEGLIWFLEKFNQINVNLDVCPEKIQVDVQKFKDYYQRMMEIADVALDMNNLVRQKRESDELTNEMMLEWSKTRGHLSDAISDTFFAAQDISNFVILTVTRDL